MRFIHRETKNCKRNRGQTLKYTLFAVLRYNHPSSLQIFSEVPNPYTFFVKVVFGFCVSFVAVKNSAEFSPRVDLKHAGMGQLWDFGCCGMEDVGWSALTLSSQVPT